MAQAAKATIPAFLIMDLNSPTPPVSDGETLETS